MVVVFLPEGGSPVYSIRSGENWVLVLCAHGDMLDEVCGLSCGLERETDPERDLRDPRLAALDEGV